MSDSGLDIMSSGGVPGGGGDASPPPPARGGRRRAETPPRKPWGKRIIILVVLVALVAGAYVGYQKVSDWINGPEDYAGQGSGQVVVEIPQGANGQQIANVLFKADVVKSAEAFYQLSVRDSRAQSIQSGFYQLRKKMSSEWAMRELTDPKNKVEGRVVVPEGSRVGQIVKAIATGSEIKAAAVTKELDSPGNLGLPAEAKGNPEGWLYPATYTVEPGTTARQLLRQMVAKTLAVEKDLDIDTRAKAVGLSKEEVLTMASILEFEARRDQDYPKVARVLFNRLDQDMPLQLDSTVSYVSKREGDVWTTKEERDSDSQYNTYRYPGLPPGPIGSPGEKTIEAVLNPAKGDWLYFFADKKGATIFNTDFAKHTSDCQKVYGAGSCGG